MWVSFLEEFHTAARRSRRRMSVAKEKKVFRYGNFDQCVLWGLGED